jgi:hypothetical protein
MNGLNEDPNVESTPTFDIPVDDAWAEQFDGQEEAGEDAPSVSGGTIPSFPYYVVHFDKGTGGFTKGEKKTPVARPSCTISEGLDGTEGERVFGDLFLRVSKTTVDNGLVVPKTDKKYKEDCEAFRKKLNKVARVGKFATASPQAPTEEAIDAYAKQFEAGGGFDAIVEIREQPNTYMGVTRMQNRIIWESMRALDDPAVSRKAKPGTSAADEAREKIEAADKASAAKGSRDGKTAGSLSRKAGGLSD